MKIEIAEPGRMTQTGSSLLKLIQNNNMPVLDLLVRESIQNSLDAKKGNSKFVEVDFLTGSFNNEQLSAELEGITEPLNTKYGKKQCRFLAVRDSKTVGLTGVMNYKEIKNNEYGNLIKLVYEICKPQEEQGAGGSWGIGKTVYFRIGIGLVIYYSRIYNAKDGYSVRLAASYVEDEKKRNAMIPEYKGLSKRGIAWWGEEIEENLTVPVTDEKYVNKFLKIFGIKPYEDKETGTTIIIPYINDKELLASNRIEYLDENDTPKYPYWMKSIEEYLKIAVQRWYAPRLANPNYSYGAYLRTCINNDGIARDSMEPVFQVVQSLYNHAFNCNESDILADQDVKTESVDTKKILQESKAGIIAFTKVSRELLKMNVPYNYPEPYVYMNCEIREKEVNRPIVCFTRQPGMIITYENVGPWVSNISPCGKDEYIIGFFVLSSANKLKESTSVDNLEEYVRKSEMADHTSWNDWTEGEYNPRIITRIQTGVNKIISKEYSETGEGSQEKVRSEFGKMFGDMLLPPEGFGKQPSTPGKTPNPNPDIKRKGYSFVIEIDKASYQDKKLLLPVILQTTGINKISMAGFGIVVDTESQKISLDEWESQMGLEVPFYIEACDINLVSLDSKKRNIKSILDKKAEEVETEGITIKKKHTKKGRCFGLIIHSDEKHSMNIQMTLHIELNRNDVKPSFVFDKEETQDEE